MLLWRLTYVAFCLGGLAVFVLALRHLLMSSNDSFGGGVAAGAGLGLMSVFLVVDWSKRQAERWAVLICLALTVVAIVVLVHSLMASSAALVGAALGFLTASALAYVVNGLERALAADLRQRHR